MAGPSLNGPLTGWTSASLAPKTSNLPISPAAVQRAVMPAGFGSVPVSPASLAANAQRLAPRIAEAKTSAEALEKQGTPESLRAALDLRKKIAVWETGGQRHDSVKLFKDTVNAFKTAHPDFTLSADEERNLQLDFAKTDATLAQSVLGTSADTGSADPSVMSFSSTPTAASSGGSSLSKYNLSDSDYGLGLGPDPRAPAQKKTPLESLLAQMYPDFAAGAPADPFANPRPSGKAPTVFENVLAGLGQQRAAAPTAGSGFVAGGPSISGPSAGANLAATIPGAPPFLAGAINGVQGFNPYAQQPMMQPAAAAGTGLDLTGLAQISAEQRIQKAKLDADKAKAQANWHKSQLAQEEMRAEQANMSRLKGFSGSGFVPAMPTY